MVVTKALLSAMMIFCVCGCSAARKHVVEIPGCKGQVYVGPDCYQQPIPGGIEIRCPGSTIKYVCKVTK